MNPHAILEFVNLFCAGLLGGEEFVIRYGVRTPVASLDDQSHIQMRQALIYRLRILVPVIFMVTIVSGIAITMVNGFDHGIGFRAGGLLALIVFIATTLFGTVPINEAALTWDPAAPTENWRVMVERWERLDSVRCWAAMAAFALFLVALTFR